MSYLRESSMHYPHVYKTENFLESDAIVYFPIIKIIREENKGKIKEYATGEIISIYINGSKVKELPATEFETQSELLLNEINSKTSKGAFSVEKRRILWIKFCVTSFLHLQRIKVISQ